MRRHQQTGGAVAVQLPDSAVTCSEHPAIPEKHTAAVVVVAGQQADLPGPRVGEGLADPAHLGVLKRQLLRLNMFGRHLQGQCGQRRERGWGLAGGLTTRRHCNSHNNRGQSSGVHIHPEKQDKYPPPTISVFGIHEHVFFSYTHRQTDTQSADYHFLPEETPLQTLPTKPSTHQSH